MKQPERVFSSAILIKEITVRARSLVNFSFEVWYFLGGGVCVCGYFIRLVVSNVYL